MDKKWIIAVLATIIIGLIIGIGLAILSGNNETENMEYVSEKELADSEEQENSINQLESQNAIKMHILV